MFLFGHLGLGLQLSKPFLGKEKGLKLRYIFLGALSPDLLDKSLYHGVPFLNELFESSLWIVSGTRTFGHTALGVLLTVILSYVFKNKSIAAFSLGLATHILLDHLTETLDYLGSSKYQPIESIRGLLWPFMGNHFPIASHNSVMEHGLSLFRPVILLGEALGAFILFCEFKNSRERSLR